MSIASSRPHCTITDAVMEKWPTGRNLLLDVVYAVTFTDAPRAGRGLAFKQ
jgi:hypothetical protein